MFIKLKILPFGQRCLMFFVFLGRAELICEVVLLQIWLVIHYRFLLHWEQLGADVGGLHHSFYERMQNNICVNHLEVNKGVHNHLYAVLVCLGHDNFFLESLNEVVFFKRRTFFYLSLLSKLFFLLFICHPSWFLRSLREWAATTQAWSWLLRRAHIALSTHWHLVGVESKALVLSAKRLWHVLLRMLHNFKPQISLIKVF